MKLISRGRKSNYLLSLNDLLHLWGTFQLDSAPHQAPLGRNWARSGRLGEWVAAQDSSCVHILDLSYFFPAPRPRARPEMLQMHQLPRASALHSVTEW